MSIRRHKLMALALAVVAAGSLAGCGNDPEAGPGARLIGGVLKSKAKGGSKGGKVTLANTDPAALIPIALRAVRGPVMLAVVESRNAIAMMGRSMVNGAYETWTTASKQTLTFKRGILVETRGLGDDLMHAQVDGVTALVRARRGGKAHREMHFLDGEGKTYAITFECTVSPGPAQALAIGNLGISSRRMDETCDSGTGRSIGNTYWVAGDGHIWQSRQWVSPGVGYLVTQQLRR